MTEDRWRRGLDRREFLRATGLGLGATALAAARAGTAVGARPKVAAVVTELRYRDHANVILENFLEPYFFNGERTDSGFEVAGLYVDQTGPGDMVRDVAAKYSITVYPTIAEALCLGGDRLAVDAVLSIAEQGKYPINAKGQQEYPRKRFFDAIVDVFERSGRVVPVFNDKHLSYRWDWAREMYDTARRLKIPLMAGSSVPLAERRPPLELPAGAEIQSAVSIHGGPMESYDFHALEVLQSMVESRKGGETGVARVQFLERPGALGRGRGGALVAPAGRCRDGRRAGAGPGPPDAPRAGPDPTAEPRATPRHPADLPRRLPRHRAEGRRPEREAARQRHPLELCLPACRRSDPPGDGLLQQALGEPLPVQGAGARHPGVLPRARGALSGRADAADDRRPRGRDGVAAPGGQGPRDPPPGDRLSPARLPRDARDGCHLEDPHPRHPPTPRYRYQRPASLIWHQQPVACVAKSTASQCPHIARNGILRLGPEIVDGAAGDPSLGGRGESRMAGGPIVMRFQP